MNGDAKGFPGRSPLIAKSPVNGQHGRLDQRMRQQIGRESEDKRKRDQDDGRQIEAGRSFMRSLGQLFSPQLPAERPEYENHAVHEGQNAGKPCDDGERQHPDLNVQNVQLPDMQNGGKEHLLA
ncbi:hypothetical protein D3C71_1714220 [compost metagenome]